MRQTYKSVKLKRQKRKFLNGMSGYNSRQIRRFLKKNNCKVKIKPNDIKNSPIFNTEFKFSVFVLVVYIIWFFIKEI